MPSDPGRAAAPRGWVLGFDTSGAWCAAALVGPTGSVSKSEEMARGQAERLIPLIEELLEGAGLAWGDLCAIGVGVGPGNFTGIRIGVSAARGLALGLDVPAIGVSGFEARAAAAPSGATVAIPAPRGQVYVADPQPRLAEAASVPQAITDTAPAAQAEAIACIAAGRAGPDTPLPAPLYVRAADAAPARDLPPVLLDP